MSERLIFYCSIMFLVFFNLSFANFNFQWPLKEGLITSTFGESRADHFHDGVDIVSANKNIYPVEMQDQIKTCGVKKVSLNQFCPDF